VSPNLVGGRASHPVCDCYTTLMLIAARCSRGLDSVITSPQWQSTCCNWAA